MLDWAKRSGILLFLDSNDYQLPHSSYDCLLAVGKARTSNVENELLRPENVHGFGDWIFGHICYDHKNLIETKLVSSHPEKNGFPLSYFFVPQTVCYINKAQTALTIASFDNPVAIYREINTPDAEQEADIPKLQFTSVTDKERYLETIGKLRIHIADGDCYEINYCTEGFCENVEVDPFQVFNALNRLSPAPYAAYYRLDDKYMMCASPERYLRRNSDQILSQPIKGTARRDKDPAKDMEIKDQLRNDIKERAENVMIVDLVRNDLARCCQTGSVGVEELFGIYSFPQVHQMVSTVTGTVKENMSFAELIRNTFPMGSMTGAPKHKVMQLIDVYEQTRRELFSGTVGYIAPNGDFDFNVVIRSLFYNAVTKRLSYQTGGAITYDSDAEKEWEEMRLKAWALERIFE